MLNRRVRRLEALARKRQRELDDPAVYEYAEMIVAYMVGECLTQGLRLNDPRWQDPSAIRFDDDGLVDGMTDVHEDIWFNKQALALAMKAVFLGWNTPNTESARAEVDTLFTAICDLVNAEREERRRVYEAHGKRLRPEDATRLELVTWSSRGA